MKLDRNINPDGRGKYALINLRKDQPYLSGGSVSVSEWAVDWGGDEQFFVIKYKDKFAAPALAAYAEAIGVEINGLRIQLEKCKTDAVKAMLEDKISDLMEYQAEIDHESRRAASWPNIKLPD